MENLNSAVETLVHGSNTLFLLMGAVMVLAMHAGFAFLEVGTVRLKNQVNALSKIITDFAVSTLAYFFIGYWIAYGVTFMQPADQPIGESQPDQQRHEAHIPRAVEDERGRHHDNLPQRSAAGRRVVEREGDRQEDQDEDLALEQHGAGLAQGGGGLLERFPRGWHRFRRARRRVVTRPGASGRPVPARCRAARHPAGRRIGAPP